MRNARRRIARLEKALAETKCADTSELREAFCRDHDLAPDAVLIGFSGGAAIIALPRRESDDTNTEST
jgi:hypothetical protein